MLVFELARFRPLNIKFSFISLVVFLLQISSQTQDSVWGDIQRASKVAPVERGKLIHIKRFVAQSICPVISYEFFNSNAIDSFLEATFYFFICFLRDFPGRTFFLFLP